MLGAGREAQGALHGNTHPARRCSGLSKGPPRRHPRIFSLFQILFFYKNSDKYIRIPVHMYAIHRTYLCPCVCVCVHSHLGGARLYTRMSMYMAQFVLYSASLLCFQKFRPRPLRVTDTVLVYCVCGAIVFVGLACLYVAIVTFARAVVCVCVPDS